MEAKCKLLSDCTQCIGWAASMRRKVWFSVEIQTLMMGELDLAFLHFFEKCQVNTIKHKIRMPRRLDKSMRVVLESFAWAWRFWMSSGSSTKYVESMINAFSLGKWNVRLFPGKKVIKKKLSFQFFKTTGRNSFSLIIGEWSF